MRERAKQRERERGGGEVEDHCNSAVMLVLFKSFCSRP